MTVIVGQEIRTTAGDLIGVFLREAIPVGLSPAEAAAAVHDQGGLVGIAHPFDRFRGSVGRGETEALEAVASQVDWIEAWNARLLIGDGNARAAELAKRLGVPGVAVSDAHTTLEVGIAWTAVTAADPSTAEGLRAALAGPLELVTGRASRVRAAARARGEARAARSRAWPRPGRDGDAMTSIPPLAAAAPEPQDPEVRADQLSLGRRLRQPRTLISLILPLVLLGLFVSALPGFKLDELPGKLASANPWLLIGAFVVFYAGFPLRGLRWAFLVRQSGFELKVRDSMEIIFLSWLVNCLVPAKLGDVYRAYLLKINSTVSLSRTFGTVFIERILDLFAIVTLGLAAGFVSFRGRLPGRRPDRLRDRRRRGAAPRGAGC